MGAQVHQGTGEVQPVSRGVRFQRNGGPRSPLAGVLRALCRLVAGGGGGRWRKFPPPPRKGHRNEKAIAEKCQASRFLRIQRTAGNGEVDNASWPRCPENPAGGLSKVKNGVAPIGFILPGALRRCGEHY